MATSASSNVEQARQIIQKWQNELPIRTDMVVRENSKKFSFNKKDIEKTIKELSEFIAEIYVALAQSQTVKEMDSGLNAVVNALTERKWRTLETYEILPPKEKAKITKMLIRIDIKLAIIRPLSHELDKLLPKKVKHTEPSLFETISKTMFSKPLFSKKSEPLPSYKRPGDEIDDSVLGGSKRKTKQRKSRKSRKSRTLKKRALK